MTVGELKNIIKDLDDNMDVALSDPDGTSFDVDYDISDFISVSGVREVFEIISFD